MFFSSPASFFSFFSFGGFLATSSGWRLTRCCDWKLLAEKHLLQRWQ